MIKNELPARTRLLINLFACSIVVWAIGLPAKAQEFNSGARLSLELNDSQRERLHQSLGPMHDQYDPAEKMLRQPFHSPGYHTTLKGGYVHPTRASLYYAIGLLDTGEEHFLRRAEEILRRVIALQDQDPSSRSYGIWSWFLEEPLDKMSPPDWNWADFCGTALLQAALYHRHRLPSDLAAMLDTAIQHAARSIQRRNVGPGYTNIAIMGAYVTLVTAETYGLADLRQYALARLRQFHDYTMQTGAFNEYNSPTYTVVALEELGRLRLHAKDAKAQELIEPIYRMAWEEIAHHFHPPTRQWSGPHSRCYRTLLGENVLSLIHQATDGRVSFGVNKPRLDEGRLPLPCPRDFEQFFCRLESPREIVKTFVKGDPPVVGTTYIDRAFSLGTVNRGDLWNQRRPLLAYWGTAQNPGYLRVRFLHDGYDFSAAQFFSAQKRGRALAGINFALDGGDTHISLDRIKNAMIQAKDLRLRFEFGGSSKDIELAPPSTLNAPAKIKAGDLKAVVAVPIAQFGIAEGRWDCGGDDQTRWLDVVLYSGEERSFCLSDLETAAIGLGIELGTDDLPEPVIGARLKDGRLDLTWDALSLSIPAAPAKVSELHRQFRADVATVVEAVARNGEQ